MPTHGAILLAAAFPATAQRRGPLPAPMLAAAASPVIAQRQVLLPEPILLAAAWQAIGPPQEPRPEPMPSAAGQRLITPVVPVLAVHPLHHHHAMPSETTLQLHGARTTRTGQSLRWWQ